MIGAGDLYNAATPGDLTAAINGTHRYAKTLRCRTPDGRLTMAQRGYVWPNPCICDFGRLVRPVTEGYCQKRPQAYQCRLLWIDAWKTSGEWEMNDLRSAGHLPRAWLTLSNKRLLRLLRGKRLIRGNAGRDEISRGSDDTVVRDRHTKRPRYSIEHGWDEQIASNRVENTLGYALQCRTDVPQGPLALFADALLPFIPGTRVECRGVDAAGGWKPGVVESMDRANGTLLVRWDHPIHYLDPCSPEQRITALFTANNVAHLVRTV